MKSSYTTLIRIIDLGLLLLMAFFAVADLSPDMHVALPTGKAAEPATVYRIALDTEMRTRIEQLPAGDVRCEAATRAVFKTCLRSLAGARFLVEPHKTTTLQQVVDILDLCEEAGTRCPLAP